MAAFGWLRLLEGLGSHFLGRSAAGRLNGGVSLCPTGHPQGCSLASQGPRLWISPLLRRTDSIMNTRFGIVAVLSLAIGWWMLVDSAIALEDPLPSWKEGPAKSAMLRFVDRVVDDQSPDFVTPRERVATFDNDGTLWSEQPAYFQLAFAIDRIKALAAKHPEWKDQEPFASVLKGDMESIMAGGEPAIVKLVAASHSGVSIEEFREGVKNWIDQARHPQTGRLYKEMVFQPMLELIRYLRAHDFKVFIVSGGGIEFMRAWAEEVYGIPPEQVIGSRANVEFQVVDGIPRLVKLPELDFVNDKAGKPVGIATHIGRRPLLACGNSDGDMQMLQYTTVSRGASDLTPRLGIIIHHTDAEREWAYDRQSHVGKLDQALDLAESQGWVVVDMKRDWAAIYPR